MREALGDEFDESTAQWNLRGDISADHSNVRKMLDLCEYHAEVCRGKLKRTSAGFDGVFFAHGSKKPIPADFTTCAVCDDGWKGRLPIWHRGPQMLNLWPYYIAKIWSHELRGIRRVALFGAGEHSKWLLDVVAPLGGPEIVGLFNDRAEHSRVFKGLGVVHPTNAAALRFDAIVISSDAAEDKLFARAKACFPDTRIIRLYDGMPCGPYGKHGDIAPDSETIPDPSGTINLDTVVEFAKSVDIKRKIIEVFSELDPDPYIGRTVDGYRRAIDRFGSKWRYIDLWSLLYAYA